MPRTYRSFSLALLGLCLLCVGALGACQPAARQAAYPLPELRIGVADFSQPTKTVQLLAGYIPERQTLAGPQDFQALNSLFAAKLAATGRAYTFLPPEAAQVQLAPDAHDRNSVLAAWVEQARAAGVDLLIVPQILDWRDRVGGPSGVISPASVMADFFLIDARREGMLVQRSHCQEEQTALADNLLTFGDFVSRKGRWITAAELVGEGMDKAIREFGLNR